MTYGTLNTYQPMTMTPKYEVLEALDQLITLVSGREASIKTNDLAGKPIERIREITSIVAEELASAATTDDIKTIKQCRRKVESLTSLKTLSSVLLNEVEWD